MSGEPDGRTVIRPLPADRTQISPAAAAPPVPAAEATVFLPSPGPAHAASPPDATVFVGDLPTAPETAEPGAERTLFEPSPAQALAAAPLEDRFRLASPNPLLAAAAPILSLLGRLQAGLEPAGPDLIARLATSVRRFEERVEKGSVARQTARIARYALCETADELGATLPGADRQRWARDGLVPSFFKTASTGTGFFEALNKVLGEAEPNADLLEMMHACLMLGFQGQYRTMPAGAQALGRVQADMLAVLRRRQADRGTALSPAVEAMPAPARPRRRVPVWIVGAAAAAVLAAVFLSLRTLVASEGEALAASLRSLSPATPVTLERTAVPAPAPPPKPAPPVPEPPKSDAQFERVRAAVAAEPGKGITVEERGEFIVVTVNNSLMFPPGSARLDPGFDASAKRIAAALDAEKGAVRVVGHTDNVKPRRTSAFKSNFDLSLARAEAVKAKLADSIGNKARLSAEGKGEDEPAADNATPDGRAANRRIALMLRKDGAP